MSSTGQSTTGVVSSLKLQYIDNNGNTQNLPFPIPTTSINRLTPLGGNVLWQEDFDDPILPVRWNQANTSGTDASAMTSKRNSLGPGRSLLLISPAGTIQQTEVLTLSPQLNGVKRYGFEGWWSLPSTTGVDQIFFGMEVGVNPATPLRYDGWVRYHAQSGILQIETPTEGTQSTLATFNPNITLQPYTWHYFKLVIDASLNQYFSLTFDNNLYSLTGTALASSAAGAGVNNIKTFAATITANNNAAQYLLYYDKFVFTIEG